MHPAQRLSLSIVLPLRNQAQLTTLLKQLYDPSSPEFHHFLTVAEFADQFGPTAADYRAVADFAKANGFTVTDSMTNRLVVPVNGTVDQVQKAFNVTMQVYQHPTENRTFYSPDRAPSLALGVPVAHIAGLNDFSIPSPMVVKPGARRSLAVSSAQGAGPSGSYLPSDMRAAYYGGSLTGAGQTVALVQFDGYNIQDVVSAFNGAASATTSVANTSYRLTYGPNTSGPIAINNVLLDEATGAAGQFMSPADDSEQVLDIAQAIGMAPGLSEVRVYIGASDTNILSKIAAENVAKQISISWSWSPDDPSVVDTFFQEFAAQGQSVFVASGDYGAYSPSQPYYYPAEDPWVTAVGGTSLVTNGAGGAWVSEASWLGSGGGVSPDGLTIPGYQAGVATSSNRGSATLRNVPDVAMEANGDNYDCNMSHCSAGWGGTSFAAPRWAGFMALVNEQAATYGWSSTGFLNIPLYALAQSPQYGSVLHDIIMGTNGYEAGYSFNAMTGYDLVTGWGSPNGTGIINALAPPTTNSFSLSAAPNSFTLDPGASTQIDITVKAGGTFSGAVNLTISGLPSGVTGAFSPSPTTGKSVLTLTAGTGIMGGAFFPRILGTSGGLSATTNLSIAVNAPLGVLSISSPEPPLVPSVSESFKPGTPIAIIGSLLGQYQNLTLQWAEGSNPAGGWTTTGVTLNGSLSNPALNQTIGTWDTSSITTADYYTIRISAAFSGVTYTANTVVYLDPGLFTANWPRWFNAWSQQFEGPVPYTDSSGNMRLAATTTYFTANTQDPAQIRTFPPDGSSAGSLLFLQNGSSAQPAAGDLDVGAGDDLVGTDSESVLVFRPDGTSFTLSPDPSLGYLFFFGRAPILEDVDGDSLLDVVAMGTEPNSGGNAGTPAGLAYVFAWRNDGQLLNSNFPFTVPDTNLLLSENSVPRVVVGDVDGDGAKEFVVIEGTSSTTVTPRLFSASGTQKSWAAPAIANFPCQLSLADLDHNGKLETILFTCDGHLHILQPDGTERTGWPQTIPYSVGTVTVGDLNRDGHEEIVVSSGNIYIFNTDGTSYSGAWPKLGSFNPTTFFYGQAVLADVNGDGYPEIVTTLENNITTGPPGLQTYLTAELVAFDRFGNTVRSWDLPGSHGEAPGEFIYATVGDFDNDGLTDIAVQYGLSASGTAPPSSVISIYGTGAAFHENANDWPMMYRDSRNTSVLRRAAASSVSLTLPAGIVTTGQPASVTVTVAPVAPATGTPTGKANLLDGSRNIGSCQLASGSCTITGTFTAGTHSLIAGYVGDTNFADSLSGAAVSLAVVNPLAAPPTFSPVAGTYPTAQTVTISDTTPGASIHYTTNGTTPTASSTAYGGPIAVTNSETIEAIAIANGYSTSAVASASYTIMSPSNPVPAIIALSPAFTDAGGPGFTLTVSGAGFASGSVAYLGTAAMTTSFVSATELTAQIPAAQIGTTGTATVTVQTPAPGGGTSNRLLFEIDSASGTAAAPKFTTLTATVSAGTTASYPVTLPSSATNVSVTCLNLPAGATCSYSSSIGTVTITTAASTPAGTYEVTVVFTETLPGTASALVLVPILLLPIALVRRGLRARGAWFTGCVVFVLTLVGLVAGCGGGGSSSTPNPPPNATHTVTSSGTVTLIVQ